VALNNGVPADQIILMAYDDIANNEGNPFPGKLFNTANGTDVYEGCVLDYKGADVSMANFFKILNGEGTGKVLKSTTNDTVFVFYSDHGAPGYVTFPSGPAMYAPDLHTALQGMHANGRYKELLFYMDACESGSMFSNADTLPPNMFAVTAADPKEESFATFCPPDDKVISENDRETFSCLGDIFSIDWMLDSSFARLTAEKVGAQVDRVAKEVKVGRLPQPGSHVSQYGNHTLRNQTLSVFQGPGKSQGKGGTGGSPQRVRTAVSQRDVPLVLAEAKVTRLQASSSAAAAAEQLQAAKAELKAVREGRAAADAAYSRVAKLAAAVSGFDAELLLGPVPFPITDAR